MPGRENGLPLARRVPGTTRRELLLRRLATLRNLEAFNILLFWLLFASSWANAELPTTWGFRAYALAIVTVILAEGACYWHLKLRSVRSKRPLPTGFRRTFARLRSLDIVLFAACPPIWGLLSAAGASSSFDLVMGSLLVVFAGLEYLNYFYVQLMHDSRNDWTYLWRHRRLRRAPLAKDLVRRR